MRFIVLFLSFSLSIQAFSTQCPCSDKTQTNAKPDKKIVIQKKEVGSIGVPTN